MHNDAALALSGQWLHAPDPFCFFGNSSVSTVSFDRRKLTIILQPPLIRNLDSGIWKRCVSDDSSLIAKCFAQ
jgi:hypothetical protein